MEAEDEIEKWENSPVKIHSHKFNQDDKLKSLDHRTRGQLATFFDAWLTHHGIQKSRWKKMVKTRWLLQRMKTNRILGHWMRITRESKVRKVKEAMIAHSRYRATIKVCFSSWKGQKEMRHLGLKFLQQTMDRKMKSIFL